MVGTLHGRSCICCSLDVNLPLTLLMEWEMSPTPSYEVLQVIVWTVTYFRWLTNLSNLNCIVNYARLRYAVIIRLSYQSVSKSSNIESFVTHPCALDVIADGWRFTCRCTAERVVQILQWDNHGGPC